MKSFGRGVRSAVVLVLCALFFLLAMGITLLGSGVYSRTVAASDENFTHRTALSYLFNQVRRADRAGAVRVGDFGGADALFLREEGGYMTVLYCYGGQLRELYTEEGLGLTPEDGVEVLPLSALELEVDGAQLCITASAPDGAQYAARLAPRCGVAREVGQ